MGVCHRDTPGSARGQTTASWQARGAAEAESKHRARTAAAGHGALRTLAGSRDLRKGPRQRVPQQQRARVFTRSWAAKEKVSWELARPAQEVKLPGGPALRPSLTQCPAPADPQLRKRPAPPSAFLCGQSGGPAFGLETKLIIVSTRRGVPNACRPSDRHGAGTAVPPGSRAAGHSHTGPEGPGAAVQKRGDGQNSRFRVQPGWGIPSNRIHRRPHRPNSQALLRSRSWGAKSGRFPEAESTESDRPSPPISLPRQPCLSFAGKTMVSQPSRFIT